MKRRLTSLGCWAIGIFAGLALESVAYKFAGVSGVMAIVAFVVVDAFRVQIWRFRSAFAAKPTSMPWLFLLLGPLVPPFYFGLRLKIWAGTAELREDNRRYPGYRQPWRSMPLR